MARHPRRASGLTSRVQYGIDLGSPEAAGVDVVDQTRRGIGPAQRRPVRPLLAHGVIGVGGGQQASAQR